MRSAISARGRARRLGTAATAADAGIPRQRRRRRRRRWWWRRLPRLGWRPWLSMVAACGLGFLVWCQAHPKEPASLGTHGPAYDSVIYLPEPGHLMGDTS